MVLPLLALIASLGIAALVSVAPWEDEKLAPDVRIGPGVGVSIDEAIALPAPLDVDVARATAAEPVLVARKPPAAAERAGIGGAVGLSQNQVVVAAQPVEPPNRPLAPPQIAPPPPPTVPVALPAPAAAVPDTPPPTRIIADLDPAGAWRSVVDGDATPPGVAAVQIREGDRYALSFEFFVERMAYGQPGADNRILRLTSEGAEEPAFGLQLWDDPEADAAGGLRGLWASGEEMGGDRFLTAVSERVWHTLEVNFEASSAAAGFYEVHLDGAPVDARDGVSLIVPGSEYAQLELGIFRDPERVQGSSEVRFRSVRLGDSPEPLQP